MGSWQRAPNPSGWWKIGLSAQSEAKSNGGGFSWTWSYFPQTCYHDRDHPQPQSEGPFPVGSFGCRALRKWIKNVSSRKSLPHGLRAADLTMRHWSKAKVWLSERQNREHLWEGGCLRLILHIHRPLFCVCRSSHQDGGGSAINPWSISAPTCPRSVPETYGSLQRHLICRGGLTPRLLSRWEFPSQTLQIRKSKVEWAEGAYLGWPTYRLAWKAVSFRDVTAVLRWFPGRWAKPCERTWMLFHMHHVLLIGLSPARMACRARSKFSWYSDVRQYELSVVLK